jgi:type VI secretion system protein VasI
VIRTDVLTQAARWLGGVVVLLVVALLARYGTLSPCGMLAKDLRSAMVAKISATAAGDGLATFGRAFGVLMSGPMIESMVGALGPTQCVTALWRVNFSDDATVDDMVAAARVEDPAAAPRVAEQEPPPPPPDPEWTVDVSRSPIDDSETVVLQIDANEPLRTGYGGTERPALILRCKENTTAAYVPLGTNPETTRDEHFDEYAPFTVRYGADAAEVVRFSLSTDREALFFPDPIPAIQRMLSHDSMLIEIQPSLGIPQVITFGLTGLRDLLPALQHACNWQ